MARIDRKVRMWLRNRLEETGMFDRAFVSVSGWGYVRKETNGQPLDQAGLDKLRQAIAGAGLVIQTIRNGDDVCRIEFNVPVHANGLTGAEAVLAMFEGECPACRLPALEIV
ncbi:MAG: hypothetical protein FOGNACKC_00810 [Anaerolineae bacterium]|nr:hypothetical protein [Anaerolineae bacterium]